MSELWKGCLNLGQGVRTLDRCPNFGQGVRTLERCPNFGQVSELWTGVRTLDGCPNFGQVSKLWTLYPSDLLRKLFVPVCKSKLSKVHAVLKMVIKCGIVDILVRLWGVFTDGFWDDDPHLGTGNA